MNMDGRRFGAGLAAGLFLGFVVIAASAGASFGNFGALGAPQTFAPSGTTSTTTQTTMKTTGSSVPYDNNVTSQGNTAGNPTSTETTASSLSALTTTGQPQAAAVPSIVSFAGASRLDNLANQPATVDGLVLVPVLLALVLGGAIYRASAARRDEESSE
jgi:hypothetical protein